MVAGRPGQPCRFTAGRGPSGEMAGTVSPKAFQGNAPARPGQQTVYPGATSSRRVGRRRPDCLPHRCCRHPIPEVRSPQIGDYHFYHFPHRLPLQIATECNRLQWIAKGPDVARIITNHLPRKGLEASRQYEWVSFPSWTSRVRIPSPALENLNLAGKRP